MNLFLFLRQPGKSVSTVANRPMPGLKNIQSKRIVDSEKNTKVTARVSLQGALIRFSVG